MAARKTIDGACELGPLGLNNAATMLLLDRKGPDAFTRSFLRHKRSSTKNQNKASLVKLRSQIGLGLENRLFGGIVEPRFESDLHGLRYFFDEEPSGIEKALYITEWPNYAHARSYQTGDLLFAARKGYIIPKKYRVWPVDFDHLAKLFQEDLWQGFDNPSRANGGEDPLDLLRFPKQNLTTLTYAPSTGS
ncbi:hypothetical protein AC578_10811 [Pseudocercospora eumusae]|uniref:Uncharacterized protein n=1 Tax=Pseudocercospora eumusae TaxID=321146 RepID=A0A139GVT1_9PEZI|nr:hypothetical protein AC578_10811 [Pseudocercospora eumusae]